MKCERILKILSGIVLGSLLILNSSGYALEGGGVSDETKNIIDRLVQCPADDFQVFLSIFTEDVQVQRSYTNFPLKELHLDINARPEPKPVIKSLSRSQVLFPVIPNMVERNAKGLKIRFDQVGMLQSKISLRKEDTDYLVIYFFVKDGCWKLTQIEDWSL